MFLSISVAGRKILANEVTVCSRCHALIHEGLLEVTGSAKRGAADLVWTPVCQRGRDRSRELDEVWRGLRATRPESAAADSADRADRDAGEPTGRQPVPRARGADSRGELNEPAVPGIERDDLVRALVSLGYDKAVAERDLGRAVASLEARGAALGEEAIIREVLAPKRSAQSRA